MFQEKLSAVYLSVYVLSVSLPHLRNVLFGVKFFVCAVFFSFFGLDRLQPMLYRRNGLILRLSFCACFEGEGELITFY